ncbi:extracellular solute-binding protein [Gorillibacterium sp. sgz500922]|uniref:extracellular solute-binding protein n=1 Tax=Gorillibacterium sp. sgz500922 TaxID=3446694 RepID=UPI003F680DA3
MRIKPIAALFVSLSLAASLAGCGGGSTTKQGEETTSPAPSAAPSESASAAPAETSQGTPDMDFDMGGRVIKVVAWWDMTIPEDNPDNIQRKKNLEALQKKHNFKMEYVNINYNEYEKKVTASLLAGEPIGDIVRLGRNYTVPALVKQDLLWPLDQYVKNEKVFNMKVTNEFYTYNGRGYAFTEDPGNGGSGIIYNKTLMKQLGLKSLQDYVNDDTWNWDTFIEVAKSANRDTNNDGKLDRWGLANNGVLDPALYSNEATLAKGDKQTLDDPKTVQSFNFLNKLATEKVYRPTEGGDWQEPGQFFRQGNTLMVAGAFYQVNDYKKDMKDYELGFLPFPKGPSATNYHTGEMLYQALTIPKSVKDPDKLIYIWEKINDIQSVDDYPGQSYYESVLSSEDDINNIRQVSANAIVYEHGAYPKFPYWEINADLNSGTSPSTIIEKYKAKAQAAIDEVYKK